MNKMAFVIWAASAKESGLDREIDRQLNLIWEVAEIAKLIGRSERQTFHLLSSGQLPAKKVGGRWVAERSKLVAFFLEDAA